MTLPPPAAVEEAKARIADACEAPRLVAGQTVVAITSEDASLILGTIQALTEERDAARAEASDKVWPIEVEKLLCTALGKPWSAAGMSIVTLIAEVAGRLSEARGALEPFKRFSEAMSYMGGTFPKEGAFYSIFPAATGEREIAVEDFRKASEVYSRLSGGAAQ